MKHILLSLLILLSLAAPLRAAQAQQPSLSVYLETVDTTAYPQVIVRLNAWGADGLPLAGLQAADFTLQEDGGAPFHPLSAVADSHAPLHVALVIDVSGSMAGQPLVDAKAAAARFLDRLAPGDYAALVAFSDTVDPDPAVLDPARELDFTSDRTPLYDRIEALQAGGETHLYNAAAKAVNLFQDIPAGHRAILLLSDGRNEPTNVGDPAQAIQLAQEAHIPIFVIGLGSAIDEPYLRRLAGDSGGLYRGAPSSAELADLFADMAALLKTQYVLTFESQLPADGNSHTLSLALNAQGAVASAEATLGPLPLAPTQAPTATPTEPPPPTATPTELPPPTITPTETPPPTATSIPTPIPEEEPAGIPWLPVGLGLAALAVAMILLFTLRRKPKPAPEACARCGFDLTGKTGACPQCGETRRLPKKKK
jgi:VWFA-related protein